MSRYAKKSIISGVILGVIYVIYMGLIYAIFRDGTTSAMSTLFSNILCWGLAFLITTFVSNYMGYAAENYPFAYWVVALAICIPTIIMNIYIAYNGLWYLSSHIQMALLFYAVPQPAGYRTSFLTREYDYDIYDNITYNEYVTSKVTPGFVQKFIFQFVAGIIMYIIMFLFVDGLIGGGEMPKYLGIIIVSAIQVGWAALNTFLAARYTFSY